MKNFPAALKVCVIFTGVFLVVLTANKYSSVTTTKQPTNNKRLVQMINSRHTFDITKLYQYIIDNQRVRIMSEMDQFPVENNQDINDFIPDQGGQPSRAMVRYAFFKAFFIVFFNDIIYRLPPLGEVGLPF